MKAIRGVLVDLGGVVYHGDKILPGAIEAIKRLREGGIALRFLTNTTSRPISEILSKLKELGLEIPREEIFTPSIAARAYITDHDIHPHYLVHPSLLEDFEGVPTGGKPAVIVGDARDGFNYRTLNMAFRRLQSGAELVALATNRMFVDDDGELSLDVGAFISALEYASGLHAKVLGKPSAAFFHMAVESMELLPAEVAMIGDDAEFDASAAVKAGLNGYLVKTGKWKPVDNDACDPAPSGIFSDLMAVAKELTSKNGS